MSLNLFYETSMYQQVFQHIKNEIASVVLQSTSRYVKKYKMGLKN